MRHPLSILVALLITVGLAASLTPQRHVVATSKASLRGAEIFNTQSCARCHGTNGVNGDRAPDLQEVRNRMDAAAIASQIRNGGKGMPPFGDQLTAQQVEDLVAYLRTKRKVIVPAPAAAPGATKQDPDN